MGIISLMNVILLILGIRRINQRLSPKLIQGISALCIFVLLLLSGSSFIYFVTSLIVDYTFYMSCWADGATVGAWTLIYAALTLDIVFKIIPNWGTGRRIARLEAKALRSETTRDVAMSLIKVKNAHMRRNPCYKLLDFIIGLLTVFAFVWWAGTILLLIFTTWRSFSSYSRWVNISFLLYWWLSWLILASLILGL